MRLRPSAAPVWGNCAGSVFATLTEPEAPTNARTVEGNAAHWVIESCLKQGIREPGVFLDKNDPDGTVINREMVDGAQMMIDDVYAVCDEYQAHDRLLIEHPLKMPHIHSENYGTPDVLLHLPEIDSVWIWDYKHGHLSVSAIDNLQLVNYLAGLGIDGQRDQRTSVVAKIVQPYAFDKHGPIKEWRFVLSDLRGQWNILRYQAELAHSDDPTLSPGKHCRYCTALYKCPAAKDFIHTVFERSYDMEIMDTSNLGVEKRMLDIAAGLIKSRSSAIEEKLYHLATMGDFSGGHVLESKQGRRVWDGDHEVIKALFSQIGVDISKESLITPSQAINKMPAKYRGQFLKIIEEYTTRDSALVLTPVEDSRASLAFRSNKS